jgi:lactoylglutathione lyase
MTLTIVFETIKQLEKPPNMKLGYVILYVPDVAAAVAFYENAFGVERRFLHESGQYAEMETGATALAFANEDMVSTTCNGFRRNRLDDPSAGAEVAFVTSDVPADFKRAVEAGAQPVVRPTTKPWGQVVSYVRDTNGFLVEICSEVSS